MEVASAHHPLGVIIIIIIIIIIIVIMTWTAMQAVSDVASCLNQFVGMRRERDDMLMEIQSLHRQ